MCPLCFCINESTSHLLTKCNFAEATWNLFAPRFNLPSYVQMKNEGGSIQWVQSLLKSGTSRQKSKKLGELFTFWWYIWKERNKRIFENEESPPHLTAARAEEAIWAYRSAKNSD
jgi:hypothetical protein